MFCCNFVFSMGNSNMVAREFSIYTGIDYTLITLHGYTVLSKSRPYLIRTPMRKYFDLYHRGIIREPAIHGSNRQNT